MPEPASPAVLILSEGYETNRPDLLGRPVANRGFLQGLIRYGGLETLYGYTPHPASASAAFEQLARDLGATMPVRVIERLEQLEEIGGLDVRDPSLSVAARQRSLVGPRAYALTGVTHTLSEAWAMTIVADLATAPVQPWDALVCTSQGTASMVNEMLRVEEGRLAERLGATRFPRPLLPVIPLGVDATCLAPRDKWRAAWRERLGIGAEDVAALYVGRLSRHAKVHPLPMMAALGRAARTQPRSLHLILAGWWLYPPEEGTWREQASALCPEVRLHVLDGREKAVQHGIWSAADIFAFLVENIQETFGQAPVEAMAAGLPIVATDWVGLRDNVRQGVDGILVPTLMAQPGEGREVARGFATEQINYGSFLALTARLTAVDIGAAAEAFRALATDPELRHRMGAAGRARVRDAFDWAAVIPQYRALWREQQAIRLAAPAMRDATPDPRHMDPTQAFASWPSGTFDLSQRLQPDPAAANVDLPTLLRFTAPALPGELDETGIAALQAELHRRNEATGLELLNVLNPTQHGAGKRALLWLLRTGLAVRI